MFYDGVIFSGVYKRVVLIVLLVYCSHWMKNRIKRNFMKKLLTIIPLTLLLAVGSTWFYANRHVKALVDSRIAEFIEDGDYQALNFENVSIDLRGNILLANLHVVDTTGVEYILEEIRITDFDYANEQPQHLSLTASGIRFPNGIPRFGNSPNRALNAYLDTVMDEDLLPMTFNYRYNYQPNDDRQLDTTFSIALPGSFKISSDSVIKNVSLEQFGNHPGAAANPVTFFMMMQDADIPSANIALRDLGMVDALMAINGENAGLSAADYRMQFLTQMQAMLLFAPQQLQPQAQRFLASIAEFLEGERTLKLSITPKFGGNIQQLQGEILGAFYIGNFSLIEEILNLEIEIF